MNYGMTSAKNSYQQVGTYSGTAFADPHRLIQMLMEGALERIARARGAIQRKDYQAKAKAINEAVDIIGGGLKGSLDLEKGGDIAGNLADLYDYMVLRLAQSSAGNDVQALDEVTRLLADIKSGWDGIRSSNTPAAASPGRISVGA